MPDVVVVPDLGVTELLTSEQPIYDRPFESRLLYRDAITGSEHYLIRYRAGTQGMPHRHTASHTIVVLDGELIVDGTRLGRGGYAHHPAGTPMLHEPTDDSDCLFVLIFDGPFDVHAIARPPADVLSIDGSKQERHP